MIKSDKKKNVELTPKFHWGESVCVKIDAKTTQWQFYAWMCGSVGDVYKEWNDDDTRYLSYRVVFPVCKDCKEEGMSSSVWIAESDLESDEEFFWYDDDLECVYVPHGKETTLTKEEIRTKYIYQWDDWDGVWYSIMPRDERERMLFEDDLFDEDEEEIEEAPKKRGRPAKKS